MQITDERVENTINKLVEVRGKKPGKHINLSEDEINYLISKAKDVFIN
jgi:serine/threonine-protein phosphatase PP1 catalytic subunit